MTVLVGLRRNQYSLGPIGLPTIDKMSCAMRNDTNAQIGLHFRIHWMATFLMLDILFL